MSLGLGWNKASDTLFSIIPTYQQKAIIKRKNKTSSAMLLQYTIH